MLHVVKSRWLSRWHVYEIDTGGKAWLATFRFGEHAEDFVNAYYADHQ